MKKLKTAEMMVHENIFASSCIQVCFLCRPVVVIVDKQIVVDIVVWQIVVVIADW